MITNFGSVAKYTGLSTDEKPLDADLNDLMLELDTGDIYYFTGVEGSEWAKVGAAE